MKCGGTSVRTLLREHFGAAVGPPLDDLTAAKRLSERPAFPIETGHISWAECRKWLPDHHVMTVLREPRERMLSFWAWSFKARGRLYRDAALRSGSIREFLGCREIRACWDRAVFQLASEGHPQRQRMGAKEAVACAKRNLTRCAYWDTLDRVDVSLPLFLTWLGAQNPVEVPHLKGSEHVSYADLDPRDQAAVDEATAWERELYVWAWDMKQAECELTEDGDED